LITVNYALVALVISGLLVYQNHTWKFVAPYRRQDDSSYRWHRPSFSFSRIQRSPSSASNSGQSTGTQSVGSKEVDGGVGRAPHTAQSSYSNATKGTPQDFVSTLGNNHQGEPTVLTTRAEPLRRRPVIPKSQAQFKGLALKMLCMSLNLLTSDPYSHCVRQGILSVSLLSQILKHHSSLFSPQVYIALILPITCSRLNFKNPPTLPVMLAFMCLLWLMVGQEALAIWHFNSENLCRVWPMLSSMSLLVELEDPRSSEIVQFSVREERHRRKRVSKAAPFKFSSIDTPK